VVYDCEFRAGGRDGLRLAVDTTDALIVGSRMIDNYDDGITLHGSGHRVLGNLLRGRGDRGENGAAGIEIYREASDLRIENNRFEANRYALDISNAENIAVRRNTMSRSLHYDVAFGREGATSGITLEGNLLSIALARPLLIPPGENGGVLPAVITNVEGISEDGGAGTASEMRLSGEAPEQSGTIELYAPVGEHYAPLGQAGVSRSTWQKKLALVERPYVLFTNTKGETSELRPYHGPDLVVTTAEDQLDGATTRLDVEAHGGPDELSLREAITIANRRRTPQRIRFDIAATDRLEIGPPDPSPGGVSSLLPEITAQGLQIEGGSGSDPLPQLTSTSGAAPLLAIDAPAVSITHLGVICPQQSHACLLAGPQADDLRVVGCTFSRPESPSPPPPLAAAIRVAGSAADPVGPVEIIDNTIGDTGAGIVLREPHEALVRGNRIDESASTGIHVVVQGASNAEWSTPTRGVVTLRDNYIRRTQGAAIKIEGAYDPLILGNVLNRLDGAGIVVIGHEATLPPEAYGARIIHNTLFRTQGGIDLSNRIVGATVINNLISQTNSGGGASTWGINAGTLATLATASHNILHKTSPPIASQPAWPLDSTDSTADPKLLEVDGWSEQLEQGSVAIDKGAVTEGRAYEGLAPDIGAWESSPTGY
jgi:hypothetical protein